MNATTFFAQDIASEHVSSTISAIAAATLLETCGTSTYAFAPVERKSQIVGLILASAEDVAAQVPWADAVFAAKRSILWEFSNLDLDLVDSVLRETPTGDGTPLSDVHWGQAHLRLTELLEQQVFRNPSSEPGAGMDLCRFVATPSRPAASAVGWARTFLRGRVVEVIGRTRGKSVNSAFETEAADWSSAEMNIDRKVRMLSATSDSPEDQVMGDAENVRREGSRDSDEIFASWSAAAHTQGAQVQVKRGAEKLHADAAALHEYLVLPALCTPETAAESRLMLVALAAAPLLARRSLEAVDSGDFMATFTGNRSLDEAFLSLWDDYSAADRSVLLDRNANVAQLLAEAAVTLPAKPARARVTAFAKAVKTAMPATKRLLVDAFLAEYSSAPLGFTDAAAHAGIIAAESALAAQWETLATAALATASVPTGVSTVADLAVWMSGHLAAV